MLFNLKSLASALLLSTAAFGVSVEHLVKRAQPKGIDVSSNQGSINWSSVASKGITFAYIKATEGTCKSGGTPVVQRLTFHFSLQEPRLLCSVYWRYQGRPPPWWLPLRPPW